MRQSAFGGQDNVWARWCGPRVVYFKPESWAASDTGVATRAGSEREVEACAIRLVVMSYARGFEEESPTWVVSVDGIEASAQGRVVDQRRNEGRESERNSSKLDKMSSR